jgi:hypothetical protein
MLFILFFLPTENEKGSFLGKMCGFVEVFPSPMTANHLQIVPQASD